MRTRSLKFIAASDLHGDKQDPKSVAVLKQFTKDFKPDIKLFLGDLWDFRPLRRGAGADERAESMMGDYYEGVKFLKEWKPDHYLLGNHSFHEATELFTTDGWIGVEELYKTWPNFLVGQFDIQTREISFATPVGVTCHYEEDLFVIEGPDTKQIVSHGHDVIVGWQKIKASDLEGKTIPQCLIPNFKYEGCDPSKCVTVKKSPYNGLVYCVTMPLGTVISRIHGKTAWTGNCQRLWDLQESRGVEADYAMRCVQEAEALFRKLNIQTYPYHKSKGLVRVANSSLKVLHGFYCGLNAARQHALTYNSCLFGHVHCFPMDTEIITKSGWKKKRDLEIGEDVLSFNIETGDAEWKKLLNVVERPHRGPLKSFRIGNSQFRVTPDHDMIVSPPWFKNHQYRKVQASKLPWITYQFPCAGHLQSEDYPISDKMLNLLGWIITEGSFDKVSEGKYQYISIAQSDKPKANYKDVTNLLDSMKEEFEDLSYSCRLKEKAGERLDHDAYRIRIHAGSLQKEVYRLIPRKQMELWMLNLSCRQFKILLNGLVMGDGTIVNDKSMQFTSSKEEDVDILQILLSMHGFRSTKNPKKVQGNQKPAWTMAIHEKDSRRCTFLTEEDYSGMVWCPVVEGNKTIFARQNGKVLATGNCVDEHATPGLDRRVARCIGSLCNNDMKYNERQPNSLRQSNGFAYGVILPNGNYHVWQAESVDGKWVMSTGVKEYV